MTVEARQGKASEGKRSNLYILVFGGLSMVQWLGVILVKIGCLFGVWLGFHGLKSRCNIGQIQLFI